MTEEAETTTKGDLLQLMFAYSLAWKGLRPVNMTSYKSTAAADLDAHALDDSNERLARTFKLECKAHRPGKRNFGDGKGKNCQLHATLILLSCHAGAAMPGYELLHTLSCSSCFSISKPHRSRPFTPSISKERTEAISRYTAGEGWRPGGSLAVSTCRNKPGAKPESLTSAARDPKAIEKRVQSARLAFATICCWASSGSARTNAMVSKVWRI